jgi:single-stranded-DNA-specific exonuclease
MKQDINWNIPKGPQPVPQNLLDAGLTPLLAALLATRGFDDPEAVRDFLSPGAPESVFLPLTDLDKAAARIRLAAERGEKVAVFGDYDVDGITSTCLMTDFLRRHMGLECISYIPNRLDEGYGLSADAVDALAAQGVKLIITVDRRRRWA